MDFDNNENVLDEHIPHFHGDDPLTEQQMAAVMRCTAEDEALNRVLDDEEDFEELFEEVISLLTLNATMVKTVRCGAHSLQLIVRKGIQKSDFGT